MSKVIRHLQCAIRNAALHNPEVEVAPACILWPDREWQWEAVIPALQAEIAVEKGGYRIASPCRLPSPIV